MSFEWNSRKAQSNHKKHGITLEEAATVDRVRIISTRRATRMEQQAMRKTSQRKLKRMQPAAMQPEYRFDYGKAQPNRFADRVAPGSVAILLDPDVAQVFKNAEFVNSVLRALVATMPTRRATAKRVI